MFSVWCGTLVNTQQRHAGIVSCDLHQANALLTVMLKLNMLITAFTSVKLKPEPMWWHSMVVHVAEPEH